MSPFRIAFAALPALVALAAPAAVHAAATGLPATPNFSWSELLPIPGLGQIYVTNYISPTGQNGAPLSTLNSTILTLDNGPADGDPTVACNGGQRCEAAGTLSFRSILWEGVLHSYLPNIRGAAIMGGFTPSDMAGLGSNVSFMQIYTDHYNPNGTIDGGGPAGKVNGDIPAWTTDPLARGWNYGGGAVPYNYLDVPYDRVRLDPLENVSFETALAAYTPGSSTIDILADLTWSFSTLGDVLTGLPPTLSVSGPSQTLLNLYAQSNPGYSYQYVGGVQDVPEPATAALLATAAASLWPLRRRHRVRQA